MVKMWIVYTVRSAGFSPKRWALEQALDRKGFRSSPSHWGMPVINSTALRHYWYSPHHTKTTWDPISDGNVSICSTHPVRLFKFFQHIQYVGVLGDNTHILSKFSNSIAPCATSLHMFATLHLEVMQHVHCSSNMKIVKETEWESLISELSRTFHPSKWQPTNLHSHNFKLRSEHFSNHWYSETLESHFHIVPGLTTKREKNNFGFIKGTEKQANGLWVKTQSVAEEFGPRHVFPRKCHWRWRYFHLLAQNPSTFESPIP